MKINLIFYSLYGHIYRMAEAAAAGAREVDGAEVELFRYKKRLLKRYLKKWGQLRQKIVCPYASMYQCSE